MSCEHCEHLNDAGAPWHLSVWHVLADLDLDALPTVLCDDGPHIYENTLETAYRCLDLMASYWAERGYGIAVDHRYSEAGNAVVAYICLERPHLSGDTQIVVQRRYLTIIYRHGISPTAYLDRKRTEVLEDRL